MFFSTFWVNEIRLQNGSKKVKTLTTEKRHSYYSRISLSRLLSILDISLSRTRSSVPWTFVGVVGKIPLSISNIYFGPLKVRDREISLYLYYKTVCRFWYKCIHDIHDAMFSLIDTLNQNIWQPLLVAENLYAQCFPSKDPRKIF